MISNKMLVLRKNVSTWQQHVHMKHALVFPILYFSCSNSVLLRRICAALMGSSVALDALGDRILYLWGNH